MDRAADNFGVVPLVFTVGSIIIVGVAVRYYLSRRKNKTKSPVLLKDSTLKYELPLIEKKVISPDTRIFRFGLPTSDHVLGLPVGQHVHLVANINDEIVIRAYTPISSDDDHGFVDLLIKVYFKQVHPKFPEGGKITQYLENMKIGDKIPFKGPSGRLVYKGKGSFTIKLLRKEPPTEYNMKKLVMIAGGTGITPMLQLVRQIAKDPEDHTKVSLLFASQAEEELYLREEIEELAKQYPDQFKYWYTIDRSTESWKYSTGYVNADIIKEHMYPPGDDTFVLMCGPPPMINFACSPSLDKLEYNPKLRFAY